MINRSEIFKRAWEIKRQDERNLFSLCLKMAWAEARAPKAETFEEKVERLSEKYSRWTKTSDNGKKYDRIYFNPEDLGLKVERRRTGSILCAEIDGREISNSRANRLLNEKAYWDLTTGELRIDRMIDEFFGDKIRAEIA